MNVVSLFSGCGGLDLGFENAGYSIKWANDNDKYACEIYRHNIGEILCKDIREVSVDEIPDCDVLIGGFPCQPFSSAGSRKGEKDIRGSLYEECFRIIADKKPSVVVLENVRGLLSIKDQKGNKLIDKIYKQLGKVGKGYNVSYQLVNASDYGVPQNRYRLIIVAFDKSLGKTFVFPKPYVEDKSKLTLRNVLKGLNKKIPNQDEFWAFSPSYFKMIPFIPEGGSWKNVPYKQLPARFRKIRDNMKKYKSPNFYRRFSRDEIVGTITAAATPENSGITHPTKDRRYTVREIARIQSFPDDFIFVGESLRAKYRVIGNAVPPLLGEAIAESILLQLKGVKPKADRRKFLENFKESRI